MISIAPLQWEELLHQLQYLIRFRISEIRNFPAGNEALLKPEFLTGFNTGFISESLGIVLGKEEEFLCFIALLPYLFPGFFDNTIAGFFPEGTDLPELGGVKGIHHRGFMPTGETGLFLLAGQDTGLRINAMRHFQSDGPLEKYHILAVERPGDGEPPLSGKLVFSSEMLEKLFLNGVSRPRLSFEFPAQYISTAFGWENLVISQATMSEVETIRNWIAHHDAMVNDWGMKEKFKSGYKALFYGPPGTGKTLTATLLGKQFNMDVFRIDLSQIVSKYIGETEKNLERIFRKAENRNWILFFDEADALFGKRTSVSNAHDRYANQETSYLLQRIEEFNGLVILASNNKTNIDAAFLRRFNAIVHFPMPDPEERLHLWKIYLPSCHSISETELHAISGKYEISGSMILNSIHHSAINAYASQRMMTSGDILASLQRELRKEDRMIS